MSFEETEGLINVEADVAKDVHIYTVSELTKSIKCLLEDAFPAVWVEGEISNFSASSAGHIYFTLKDGLSQISCALFKNVSYKLKFKPGDGLKILCFGRISVYGPRGSYQLIVERVEPKGLGALQLAFEQLKEKLNKEGLFDPSGKKQLPYLPTRIGVVTSPTGAAIRDILNVTTRRFQNIEILINPVRVQGKGAAEEIAKAIREFNEFGQVDVLIVGRGGGSVEDLWAFNEEVVARAIFDSTIPVISAVGHHIDWTISDFVADLRAATPSAAAELVIPKKADLTQGLKDIKIRLRSALLGKFNVLRERLNSLSTSYVLRDPLNFIRQHQQRIDELAKNITVQMSHALELSRERFMRNAARLEALSPLAILNRGYSITTLLPEGRVIKSASTLKKGQELRTRLAEGELISRISEIKKKQESKNG